jgi:armadillo repeat-containing protein 8
MDTSTRVRTFVTQLLGPSIRAPSYRTAIAECIPPTERGREALHGRHRWEPLEALVPVQICSDEWVICHLTALLHSRDVKVQEAAVDS